jgi:hypothetical protein
MESSDWKVAKTSVWLQLLKIVEHSNKINLVSGLNPSEKYERNIPTILIYSGWWYTSPSHK